MISSRTVNSPVGLIYLEAEDGFLSICAIEGQDNYKTTSVLSYVQENEELLDKVELWLDRYFHGVPLDPNEIPLLVRGTEFQLDVWNILKDIPYGQTRTYGVIAKIIGEKQGKKMSAQAVGRAIGKNPISIIVPCHRVIGANQKLVGYNGGLDKKEFLLNHEKAR